MLDKKQTFSIRKLKTQVGSVLLATSLLSGTLLQGAIALAEDNQGADFTAQAGKSEGSLHHEVIDSAFEAAVKEAESQGVRVTYGQTLSATDLKAAQEALQSQRTSLETVTTQQKAVTEAVATVREAEGRLEAAQASGNEQELEAAQAAYEQAISKHKAILSRTQTALKDNLTALRTYKEDQKAYQRDVQTYETALATHQSTETQNNQLKAAYEAEKVRYEADLARYNAAVAARANLSAEDQAKRAAYERALADYQTQLAEHQRLQAQYEADMATAAQNTGVDGYLSQAVAQNLIFSSESSARIVSITGQESFLTAAAYRRLPSQGGSLKAQEIVAGDLTKNQETTAVWVKTGGRVTVRYAVNRSSYAGKKIAFVEYDHILHNAGTPNGYAILNILTDPTQTVHAHGGTRFEAELRARYYDEAGNQISYSADNPALFAFSSLNHSGNNVEFVRSFQGIRPVTITGSSVTLNGNELSAPNRNDYAASGSRFDAREWDVASGQRAWYGAAAGVATGVNQVGVSYGYRDNTTDHFIWFAFNSGVNATVVPKKPVAPIPPTPPRYSRGDKEISLEKPTPPTPPTYTPTTEPTPPTPPKVPVIAKVTDPEKLEVTVQRVAYTSTPALKKEVTNLDQKDVNNQLVAKGSTLVFPLGEVVLEAGREEVTSLVLEDPIDADMALDLETTKAAFSTFDLDYNEEKGLLQLTAKKELLDQVNKDRTKSYTLVLGSISGTARQANVAIDNTARLLVNNSYTVYSNPVQVRTSESAQPKKDVRYHAEDQTADKTKEELGKSIDTKLVKAGAKVEYTLLWDMDQYVGLVDTDKDKRQFLYVEDIPEEFLSVDLKGFQALTMDGKTYDGLEVASYHSLEEVPEELRSTLRASAVSEKLKKDFLLIYPKNMAEFYEEVVKNGNSLTMTLPATVKKEKAGSFDNTAYQIDFAGEAIATNTVTNKSQVTTEWVDTHDKVLKDMVTGDTTEEAGEFQQYRFKETKETETGIKHIFEKLYTTEWVDEAGNPLKDKVTDIDTKPSTDFADKQYQFVETKETETGIKHIFTKLKVTEWVDEAGNPLKDPATGKDIKPADEFKNDEYEFVRTDPTDKGARHVFRKKVASTSTTQAQTPPPKGFLPSTGEHQSGIGLTLGLWGLMLAAIAQLYMRKTKEEEINYDTQKMD